MASLNNQDKKKPIVSVETGAGFGNAHQQGGIAASHHAAGITFPKAHGSYHAQLNSTSFSGFSGVDANSIHAGSDHAVQQIVSGLRLPGYQAPAGELYTVSLAANRNLIETGTKTARGGMRFDGGVLNDATPVLNALKLSQDVLPSQANTVDPNGFFTTMELNGGVSKSNRAGTASAGVFAAGAYGNYSGVMLGGEVSIGSKGMTKGGAPTLVHSAQFGQAPTLHATSTGLKPGAFKATLYAKTYLSGANDYRVKQLQKQQGGKDIAVFESTTFGDQYLGESKRTGYVNGVYKDYTVAQYDIVPSQTKGVITAPTLAPYHFARVNAEAGAHAEIQIKRVNLNADVSVATNPVRGGEMLAQPGVKAFLADQTYIASVPDNGNPRQQPAPGLTDIRTKLPVLNLGSAQPVDIASPVSPNLLVQAKLGVRVTLGK